MLTYQLSITKRHGLGIFYASWIIHPAYMLFPRGAVNWKEKRKTLDPLSNDNTQYWNPDLQGSSRFIIPIRHGITCVSIDQRFTAASLRITIRFLNINTPWPITEINHVLFLNIFYALKYMYTYWLNSKECRTWLVCSFSESLLSA